MRLALLILIQAALIGCAGVRADDPASLPEGIVTVHASTGEHPLAVELAETPEARARGLRGRDRLPGDRGMLFLFPGDRRGGFWMHGVRMPLDIAFATADGTIVRTMQMEPCRAPLGILCPSYDPGVRYRMALEVSAGWLAEREIASGDRLVVLREDAAGVGTSPPPARLPHAGDLPLERHLPEGDAGEPELAQESAGTPGHLAPIPRP